MCASHLRPPLDFRIGRECDIYTCDVMAVVVEVDEVDVVVIIIVVVRAVRACVHRPFGPAAAPSLLLKEEEHNRR